ncbi:hypothetical protein MLD52_19555 [Puniceicoccaceae bacterium K14]|nr:hypothetical protein [Puniceicoccaceae bacterium K14]
MELPRFRQFMAAFMLLALAWANGVHVVALQGMAWVKMYDEYSESMSVSEALDYTLSGKELCGGCVIAEDLRTSMDDVLDDFAESRVSIIVTLADSGVEIPKVLERGAEALCSGIRELQETLLSLRPPPPRTELV